MSNPYIELASALAPDGIRCQFQSAGQMVVSSQIGPIWPDRGNSFWVTNVNNQWYLFTWGETGYGVPRNKDVVDLCRRCMAFDGDAMCKVPAEIVEEFALFALSDEDARVVIHQMGK